MLKVQKRKKVKHFLGTFYLIFFKKMSIEEVTGRKTKRKKRLRAVDDAAVCSITATPSAKEGDKKHVDDDPVYRIMNRSHRSDIIEIVRCKFGPTECARMVQYFHSHFGSATIRKLRVQVFCSTSDAELGALFRTVLPKHTSSIKILDLSRNVLSGEGDAQLLISSMTLHHNSILEVLDLSFNPLGNKGAALLMAAIADNVYLRALILVHCDIDNDGGEVVARYLRARPRPRENETQGRVHGVSNANEVVKAMFFVNLNRNRIGSLGCCTLGKRLPDWVSVTVVQQIVRALKT